jgi:hypothetical protein
MLEKAASALPTSDGTNLSVTVTSSFIPVCLVQKMFGLLEAQSESKQREKSRQATDHGCHVRAPERGRDLDRAFTRCRFEAGSGGFPLAGPQAEKIT